MPDRDRLLMRNPGAPLKGVMPKEAQGITPTPSSKPKRSMAPREPHASRRYAPRKVNSGTGRVQDIHAADAAAASVATPHLDDCLIANISSLCVLKMKVLGITVRVPYVDRVSLRQLLTLLRGECDWSLVGFRHKDRCTLVMDGSIAAHVCPLAMDYDILPWPAKKASRLLVRQTTEMFIVLSTDALLYFRATSSGQTLHAAVKDNPMALVLTGQARNGRRTDVIEPRRVYTVE